MATFGILDHLAVTHENYSVSSEIVEQFMRSYYAEMYAADVFAHEHRDRRTDQTLDLFEKAFAAFRKYWLTPTRYSDYWRPSLSWPSDYEATTDRKFEVVQDMLGNFLVGTVNQHQSPVWYLVSLQGTELRIVNRFF